MNTQVENELRIVLEETFVEAEVRNVVQWHH